MSRYLLLPDAVPAQARRTLLRLGEVLSATPVAGEVDAAPAEGLLLHWLGGGDGRYLTPPPQAAQRLVLLAVHRSALRPLALRLRPAALVEDFAFSRWERGGSVPDGRLSGIVGLRQAPLAVSSPLDAGDYVFFRGDGAPLTEMLDRYLGWFEAQT